MQNMQRGFEEDQTSVNLLAFLTHSISLIHHDSEKEKILLLFFLVLCGGIVL